MVQLDPIDLLLWPNCLHDCYNLTDALKYVSIIFSLKQVVISMESQEHFLCWTEVVAVQQMTKTLV